MLRRCLDEIIVPVKVLIVVIKHHGQKKVEEERIFWGYISTLFSVTNVTVELSVTLLLCC